MKIASIVKWVTVVSVVVGAASITGTAAGTPVKVFILAGQSNMQGKGTIEHLEQVVRENPEDYGHLQRDGKWVEHDDVWVDYLSDRGRKKGKLTVGYATPEDRIGPELGFGMVVGEALAEPVLIIKYAVGGRAIALEFRPPSSGPIDPCTIPEKLREQIEDGRKTPGSEYRLMMTHIKSVLGNLQASVPPYSGGPVELAGFVWFQGWNDQYNGFEAHYQENMANLIRDIRAELQTPHLPFVIGGMGQGGDKPMYKSAVIRKAQAATAEMPEFKDNNVRYIPTAPYWREGEQGDGGYHSNGNAETFLLIGEAFARAILHMQPAAVEDAESRSPRTPQTAEAVRFDPVERQIEGWTVHVDPSMLEGEHQETGAAALAMLANHLQRIAILLPPEQLQKMRKLEIWIEHHHPTLGSMQYHPSLGWLKSHGHDPRLAKKVHIPRAQSLLSRQQMVKHPAVVLHELAHAYHDQYFGFDDPRLVEAYKQAKASGIYEKVLLYDGREVRHYGLNDPMEYFAEGTEAYFYRNDFYSFCSAELKEHDPVLHDLLVEIWGPLP
ncbi:MAG: hypothetical protein JSW27_11960 [Phycisphaerales bacterium]|nr:MAG: hypothetical protein JSW27_11960 [Phycisphaerales bacterium]